MSKKKKEEATSLLPVMFPVCIPLHIITLSSYCVSHTIMPQEAEVILLWQ